MGDHTETIQIDYDPNLISYKTLLRVFWDSHNPVRKPWSQQYKSAIFYANERQKKIAVATKFEEEKRRDRKIYTEILPLDTFYFAEDYHQKYTLQSEPFLLKELRNVYPNFEDLINSTAAARINGYLDGYGTEQMIRENIDQLGLSPKAQKRLLRKTVGMVQEEDGVFCKPY